MHTILRIPLLIPLSHPRPQCLPLSFSTFSWQLAANGLQLTAHSSQLIAFIFLRLSSSRIQILHIRSGWRLTLASLLSNNKKTVRLSPAYIKIRYPSHLTSTAFYFLYYFLILVFAFQFTLPGKYENRTHHGNHCLPYRLRCWRGHVLPYFCHCPCRKYGQHGYDPDESGGVPVRTHS